MATVIINDERFEGNEGELLIDVARRNGAHVGFTCSNRGICTFCECKVLEGAELLSPVTAVEKDRLSATRLENGSRLSCMATIESNSGTIRAVSRPEKIKQQFLSVFTAPTLQEKRENLGAFLGSMGQASKDYLTMYPYVFKSIASRKVGLDILNPFKDIDTLIKDGRRVLAHQLGLKEAESEKESDEADNPKSSK